MKVDLFFCGDSNTYGEELQGIEDNHQKRIDLRYSSLVSKKLDKTHENISQSGACNDWIVKTVVEWFESGNTCETAIIQFSNPSRWGWYDERGEYQNRGSKNTTDNFLSENMKNAHSAYYKSVWTEKLALDNYWKNMFFLKNYLRGKCKVIWMTLGRLPRGNNFWRDLCHPYYIGEHKWIVDGNKCPKYDKPGFTGTHPNAVGHKNIANYLLERL